MVITVLEAAVPRDQHEELERSYRDLVAELPDAIAETFLARDREDPTTCRILTVWRSREDLDRMRSEVLAAGSKPGGVLLFEAVGVTPGLTISDVLHRQTA